MKNGHVVRQVDRGRIRCECGRPAMYCEYSRASLPTREPTRTISFWYYCVACSYVPGPMGSTPLQRALGEVSQ